MSSKVAKPIILIVVFISALFVFSMMTNKVNKDLTTTMDEATLPVVHFIYNDIAINELHGYVQEMDILSMRDGLVPLGETRALQMEVMSYGNKVDRLSYKIRSIDGERLLAEDKDADIIVGKDKTECSIHLPAIFEKDMEYNLEIMLTMGEKNVYYYTRIVQPTDCYINETLDFAFTFHDYTFRDDAVDFIPTYMDPATGDATTLSYVDLSCTLRQITWADFTGEKLTEPVASFKEINPSYNVITLDYVVTNVNENNEVEYYNVKEYYRLRKTSSRMYVLNFERTMNQIFQYENDFLLGNTAILLGIRDKEVEYLANEAGDSIAFVQEGDLWCYNKVTNRISQVFSFRSGEGIDNRENWGEHDIQIIRVDEAGSVDFLVYGYMNRGEHEGKVGVGVYYYDGISHTVEEELFISSNESYEVLQAELGELMYVNEQKTLYLSLNNDVYKIDMNSFETSVLVSSDTGDCYAVSPSGRYLAWVSPEQINSSSSITLQDLKTGIAHEIIATEGTYVKPIAFVGEDFVYGVANMQDVRMDAVGQELFLMHKLEILNTSEDKTDIIKTYRPNKGFVGAVSVDAKNIYVDLWGEMNGNFLKIGADTIMNRENTVLNGVELKTSVTDVKQTQITISMKKINHPESVKVIIPKQILVEEDRTITIEQEGKDFYYVYVKGEVLLATSDVSEAVHLAYNKNGVVVDSGLRYIFKRARNNSQSVLSKLNVSEADKSGTAIAKCISIMLAREDSAVGVSELMAAGQTPIKILQDYLSDEIVLELRNCNMEELLYYIDQETPVYAKIGNDNAVLLVGYNASYVYYYDAIKGQVQSASYEQIENMFYSGGNYFIAYVK